MCLTNWAGMFPSSTSVSSWLARTFTIANSHATKNPFNPTRPAITSSLPRRTHGGSQRVTNASASEIVSKEQNNKEFIILEPPAAAGFDRTSHDDVATSQFYQLDFVTPGINPWDASSRKVRRETLKRRMNARRRPVTSQRLTTRVGLASRGSCASAA